MDENNHNDIDPTEVMLTKAKLLEGVEEVEQVQTSMGTFKIRPMTEGEKMRAEALVFKGLKASGGIGNLENLKIEGDAEQIFKNQGEYEFYIIMCGLNIKDGEKWSIQDVKNIKYKPTVKDTLLRRIQAISGLVDLEQKVTEFFRNTPGDGVGEDDSPSGDDTGETK